MVLEAHAAETPVGKPLPPETPLFEIPVAPVVTCVMFAVFLFTILQYKILLLYLYYILNLLIFIFIIVL